MAKPMKGSGPGRPPRRPEELDGAYYEFVGVGDQRIRARVPREELGHVPVAIRRDGGSTWTEARLLDFSSVGFGIHLLPEARADAGLQEPVVSREGSAAESGTPDADMAGDPSRLDGRPLRDDDELDVRLGFGPHGTHEVRCRVRNAGPWKGGCRLGLRRLDLAFPAAVQEEKRIAGRIPLYPALSLRARIRHAFLFDRWCALEVADINRDMGLSFVSDDPSILLFEGMEAAIHFEIPGSRNGVLSARVAWVQAASAERVKFGVACVDMPIGLHNALCDFLLRSGYWTPAALRRAGFQGKRVKGHLRFSTVKTMEDYAEVLHLRRDAYVSVGKRPEGTRPERMSSPLDGRSRILMARHHGRLVGSLTFSFPPSEDTLLDTQAGFAGGRYPVHLPPKTNMIEVARLCIDEGYRGTDLLIGLFEHGLKHFLLSDRHWLLTSTTDELWPMYRRIGFVKLDATYKHPLLNNQDHHLIIAHRSAFLWGFGMGLLVWNSVFADLVRYLLERKLVRVHAAVRAVIRTKLLFRPVARLLMDAKAHRAFRKHMRALAGGRRPRPGPEAGSPGGSSLYAGMEADPPGEPEGEKRTGT